MKKKGHKLLITASAILVAGLVFCGIALAQGAATLDFWKEANEQIRVSQGLHAFPVQKSASFAADQIEKLDIDADDFGFVLKHGDVDGIQITYYEDFEGQSVVENIAGTLKIKHEFKLRFLSFGTFGAENLRTEIILPQGFYFQSTPRLDVSGNSSKVVGVNLGAIDSLTVSGGSLTMDGTTAVSIGRASVSGGSLNIKGGSIGALQKLTVSGGYANIENADSRGDTEINVSGGTIFLSGHTGSTNPFSVTVSGGRVNVTDSSLAGLKANVSGGSMYLKNSSVTGAADVKVSGGTSNIENCTFDTQTFIGKASGGTINFNSVSGIKSYDLNVSGGRIYVRGLNTPASVVSVLVDASGGGVYLNDSKVSGNRIVNDAKVTFSAKLSGGRVYINTIG